MIQKKISGGWFPFNIGNDSFTALHGGRPWSPITVGFSSFSVMAVAGTLRKFRVRLRNVVGEPTTPQGGKTYTLTVRKNEINTALKVVLDDSSPNANDMVNGIAITAGNRIDIKCEPGGGPTTAHYPLWSFEFEPTNAKESVYFVTGGPWYKNIPLGYFMLTPDASNPFDNTESQVQQIIPTAGKITNLNLELSNNPGSVTEAYRMTLMLNGSPTALVATVTGAATEGASLGTEVTVAAGDLVCWKKEAINTPTNNVNVRAGFAFEADTDGESLFINGRKDTMDTGAIRYYAMSHNIRTWDVDEFEQRQYTQLLQVSRLYVRISAAPGTDKSWTFVVRKNGVDTDLTCTISDSATTGNDTENSVVFQEDDYIDIKVTPSGSPNAAAAYFGAVQGEVVGIGTPYYIWDEETRIHHIDADGIERMFEGSLAGASGASSYLWVEGSYIAYTDMNGDKRKKLGYLTEVTGKQAYQIAIEGTNFRYVDEDGNVRVVGIGDLMGERELGRQTFG